MRKFTVLCVVVATVMMFVVSCGETKPQVKKTERVIDIKGWGYARHGEKMKSEIKAKGAAKALLMEMTGGYTFVYIASKNTLSIKLGKQREFEGRHPYILETYKAGKMKESFAVQTARIKIMVPEKQAVHKRSATMSGDDLNLIVDKLAKKTIKDLSNEKNPKEPDLVIQGQIWVSDMQVTRGKGEIKVKCTFSVVFK